MSLIPNIRIPLKRGPKPHAIAEEAPVNAEDPPDHENHVVLRVPEDCVDRFKKIIANEKQEEFAICLNPDARTATVRIGNQLLNGKVLDLPTITEVHKTMDNKNLFKVADVSQIIVCTHDSINASTSLGNNATNAEQKTPAEEAKEARREAKQWQYPHGLTAPMKCARKKRFRKTKKKKFMDAPEVEKELKRLLRHDLDAESVNWEIVDGKNLKDASVADERRQNLRYSTSSDDDSDVVDEEKDDTL